MACSNVALVFASCLLWLACSSCSAARLPDMQSISQLLSLPWSARSQAQATHLQHGWAVWDGAELKFTNQQPGSNAMAATAYANYSQASNHVSGFGQLRVETNQLYNSKLQMRSAGLVEGYLTAPQIADHWHNQRAWLLSKTPNINRVYQWLLQHYSWLTEQLAAPDNQDERFWQAMSLVMEQMHGMWQGYNARAASQDSQGYGLEPINLQEWLALNTMGDMDDLLELLFRDDPQLSFKDLALQDPDSIISRLATRGRCSVLVKVTPSLSDLLVGHVTWWTFTAMTRIYKHYTFHLREPHYKVATTSMSSYPGMITSMDDFYILDSHLIVTETSNSVLDSKVWDVVTPQSALSWQRVLVANWLSDSGSDWAHWIKQYNSGTYNNQYIVVDLSKFTPGSELRPGLLTIIEQMPGLVISADMTWALERNYWPSYNIPFFEEIYNRSGYPELTAQLKSRQATIAGSGSYTATAQAAMFTSAINSVSYQLAPRAKISRRDQGSVSDLSSLKAYMRSNNWQSEPFSGGSAFGAICGRGDVDPAKPKASGCSDAKVTSYKLAMANAAEAVNGPTLGSDGSLEPFSWTGPWADIPHKGMPTTFDFSFELQKP